MNTTLLRRPLAATLLAAVAVTGLTLPAHADEASPTLAAWGSNLYGQTTLPSSLTGKTVTAVAGSGYHDLALTSDGEITAWGSNSYGETNVPSSLAGKTVTAIAVGRQHSVALTSDGLVTAWGSNDNGERTVPTSVTSQNVCAISAAGTHNLALTCAGKVLGWGDNSRGESSIPASLANKTVTAIATGYYHSLALTSDGTITAWGNNSYAQTAVPAGLAGKTVTAISAGDYHNLALTSDGTLTAWGSNAHGQAVVPASLAGKTVTAISAGGYHNLARTSDGRITAWGENADGQSTVPAAVSGRSATKLFAGLFTSFALSVPRQSIAQSGSIEVSGTPRVGQTLTASSDVVSTPSDASTTGTWLRDDEPVAGATGTTYTLGTGDLGHRIAYRVTSSKDGYDDVSTTSAAVGPVEKGRITLPDPIITGQPVVGSTLTAAVTGVDPDDAGLTYRWTRDDATPTVVGTDATYTPTYADLGHTLTVTVTANKAAYDDATSHATTAAVTPAAKVIPLIATTDGSASKKLQVQARGMYPGEQYSLVVNHATVATGSATSAGTIERTVTLDRAANAGQTVLTLVGVSSDRGSRTTVRRAGATGLGLRVADAVAGGSETITASGLAPNEKIDVLYRGQPVVDPDQARAAADGTYTVTFPVGDTTGLRRVSVTGTFSHRSAEGSFTVSPRP